MPGGAEAGCIGDVRVVRWRFGYAGPGRSGDTALLTPPPVGNLHLVGRNSLCTGVLAAAVACHGSGRGVPHQPPYSGGYFAAPDHTFRRSTRHKRPLLALSNIDLELEFRGLKDKIEEVEVVVNQGMQLVELLLSENV